MTDQLSAGHRERLRKKLLAGNRLEDYELLELLLMYAIPRKDVKPLAKTLLAHFKSLGAVLSAQADDLMQIDGVKENTVALIKLIAELNLTILKRDIQSKKSLSTWESIENYCYALLGRETKEYVYLILLDSECCLIDAVQIQKGTLNQSAVYIREVIEVLLRYHAASFILVHNHPFGNTQPSKEDIALTKELYEASNKVRIIMQDHFIVSPTGINSFQMMGEMDHIKKA